MADPTGGGKNPPQPVRRYLDNAATSWPKLPEVLAAWEHAGRAIGAAAGRATYREAVEADAIRTRCRAAVARLLGNVDPQRVAFTAGATLGLNMAIHGLLGAGDHVIATAADHNATLRPLTWLADRGVIELSIVPCDGAGRVDPDAVMRAWRPATRLVVCSHASNVTGAVQDARAFGQIAHDRGGLFLLDAAQSLGQIACTADGCEADIIVAPSHKWLLGPAGTGILWVRSGLDLDPLIQGGTGSASDSLAMPDRFTDRMEAGTPDLPALAGLLAAELFKHMTGVSVLHVPYKGNAPALADVLGGHVSLMFDTITTSLPMIRAGKLKALATTGPTRSALAPELPTMIEAGVPGFEISAWYAVFAPAKTPRDVLERLNGAIDRAIADPELARQMAEQGVVLTGGTLAQAKAFVDGEVARWGPIIKAANIKAE